MASPSLTPVSYVVLGLLATQGPLTPYAMKQRVQEGVGHLWPFPHSQLYVEPERLVARGLAVVEPEPGGRRRRTYAVTETGRQALRAWVAGTEPSLTEIRDLGLLRLYFASAAPPAARAALAAAQAEAHAGQLRRYEDLEGAFAAAEAAGTEVDDSARATLRVGLGYERLAVDFWRDLAETTRRSSAS